MHVDELIDRVSQDEEKQSIMIGADWGQGKTTFGGISAALLTQAMSQQVSGNYRLLSLTTTFYYL